MNEDKLFKIRQEFSDAILPILEKKEYDERYILLGMNALLASFACVIFENKNFEQQKDIARNLGRALEAQIMTNYTGDSDYKVER